MGNAEKKLEVRSKKSTQVETHPVGRQKNNVHCIFWQPSDGFNVEYNLKKGDWQIFFNLKELSQKLFTRINLIEKGSSVKVFGLFIGQKTDSMDWDFKIIHQKSQTKADILIKGVLDNSAKIQFDGVLAVEPKLTEVESILRHHTFLLSDSAKALVVPSLEIKSDEAKITHASSLSTLDEEQLFYLYSRNYSYTKAKDLLVQGFLREVEREEKIKSEYE